MVTIRPESLKKAIGLKYLNNKSLFKIDYQQWGIHGSITTLSQDYRLYCNCRGAHCRHFGYILKYQGTNDSDQDYAVDLSPSSPALQQKVIDTLNQKINEEAEASDEDLDLSGNQLSMEIKLSALIRASTVNIDPTDEQLNNFYSDNSNNYTSDARIEFLYRMFNTADYGGNVVNIAHTALEKITRKGESLLDDQKSTTPVIMLTFTRKLMRLLGSAFLTS